MLGELSLVSDVEGPGFQVSGLGNQGACAVSDASSASLGSVRLFLS